MSKGRTVPAATERRPREPVQSRMETDPAVARAARQIVGEVLRQGRTPSNIIRLVEEVRALSTRLVEKYAAAEQVACRAGCAWCCSTTYVATIAPEVIRIAHDLRARLSEKERAALVERLARRAERIGALPEERRRRARLPCALLVDNRCSVYPVRPLACAGWTSSSAAACESSYKSGWERQVPNGPRHLGITAGTRQGMREGLEEAGLDGARLDLTRALHIALTTPDVAERWLAGEPVFAPAYLGPPAGLERIPT